MMTAEGGTAAIGERLLIVGSSGHARVIIDLIEKQGVHEIVGLIDRFRIIGDEVLGYAILGGEDDIPRLGVAHSVTGCCVAIGDNYTRGRVADLVAAGTPAIRFPTLIHPAATVARDVIIGAGTVLMAGVVVNTSARIGDFCILNTSSSVDHDASVGDHASLAPGARLGGKVVIGPYAAIGMGATVIQGVRVGRHSVIGAGAVVLTPVGDFRLAYGVPAGEVRGRSAGESYL
jgi:sugar O-acyltransferase (sialic acid O-acetyltransferase NeuD family)